MWTGIPDMESFPLSVEIAVTVGQSVHRVRHVDGNHAHDAWTVDDAMLPSGVTLRLGSETCQGGIGVTLR
jgi:hypothetical protein